MDGKVAVVTGGASGIGRAIAERFAKSGASVRVLDVDEHAASAVANEIARNGSDTKAYSCDVAQPQSVTAAFQRIFQHERVQILINNAGISKEEFGSNTSSTVSFASSELVSSRLASWIR